MAQSEPQYQGKGLTEWAAEIDRSDFFRLPAYQRHQRQNEQAIAAIRHIGTNALPVALGLCAAKDSWLKTKIEDWSDWRNNRDWPNKPRFQINIKPAYEKRFEGGNIVWALGTEAEPAIPALIRLLQSRDMDVADDVISALPGAGTNAIAPLLELLGKSDDEVHLRAAVTLGSFFRPKLPADESGGCLIVPGSEDFRAQTRAAVPVLLQYLDRKETSPIWRIRVIRALGLIGEDAPEVVPVLIRHIQNETNELSVMRGNYFAALGDFGTNATSAVSFLTNILESDSDQRSLGKQQALKTLMRIDPETAKPFVEKWETSARDITQTNSPPP